ncbi:MAG: hypothetical protein Q8O34_00090 [Rhodocyclaceae bacterium]|nr:hypothetical protein [Rhodocyclaceae bacterium]
MVIYMGLSGLPHLCAKLRWFAESSGHFSAPGFLVARTQTIGLDAVITST